VTDETPDNPRQQQRLPRGGAPDVTEARRRDFMDRVDSELWSPPAPAPRTATSEQQQQQRPSPSSSPQTTTAQSPGAAAAVRLDESDRAYLNDVLSEFMRRQQADLRNLHVEIVRQSFAQKVCPVLPFCCGGASSDI
jgi:hypothetical protein